MLCTACRESEIVITSLGTWGSTGRGVEKGYLQGVDGKLAGRSNDESYGVTEIPMSDHNCIFENG